MTYWQNWAVGGGAILTRVSALAGSAAAIINAMSSKRSCATTIYILQNPKRSDEATEVEGVSTELAGHGFAPYGEWYHHDNGTNTFEVWCRIISTSLICPTLGQRSPDHPEVCQSDTLGSQGAVQLGWSGQCAINTLKTVGLVRLRDL